MNSPVCLVHLAMTFGSDGHWSRAWIYQLINIITISFNQGNDGVCADCNYLSISKLKLVQMECLMVVLHWTRPISIAPLERAPPTFMHMKATYEEV